MTAKPVTTAHLAFFVAGLWGVPACAQSPVAQQSCLERCKQEMKACYRINDVIYINHCDREFKRCSAACARRD